MSKFAEKGTYLVKVISSMLTKSQSGNYGLRITFELSEKDPYFAMLGECRIDKTLYFSAGAIDISVKTLYDVFYFDGDLIELSENRYIFAGKEFKIVLDFSKPNEKGDCYLEVRYIKSAIGGIINAQEISELNDTFKTKMGIQKIENPRKRNEPESDVPF